MNADEAARIKRFALVALFSDDYLMHRLVLKGGSALNLVMDVVTRASVDLDLSIEGDMSGIDLRVLESRIAESLRETLEGRGYQAFDISLTPRPANMSPEMESFWGGYRIEFKVLSLEVYRAHAGDARRLRVEALQLGPSRKKALRIDISSHEYCGEKTKAEVDGTTVYVYTPTMIVLEKLRAICQQMPEYAEVVTNPSRSARARDFFDIWAVMQAYPVDVASPHSVDLLRHVFRAKRVPLRLIGLIPHYRDYHREDFASVEISVAPDGDLREFDFYFDFVVESCCRPLEPLWEEDPPLS